MIPKEDYERIVYGLDADLKNIDLIRERMKHELNKLKEDLRRERE